MSNLLLHVFDASCWWNVLLLTQPTRH